MSGYRRFIAYVYEYPQERKGDGRGFIKVEARGGICRMNYKLTGIYGRETAPAKVYGYVRDSQKCTGIFLGECDLAGSSVQFEYEMPENSVGGSQYGLEDLSGLVLLCNTGEMYGSGWDDTPLNFSDISFPKTNTQNTGKNEMEVKAAEADKELTSECTLPETLNGETLTKAEEKKQETAVFQNQDTSEKAENSCWQETKLAAEGSRETFFEEEECEDFQNREPGDFREFIVPEMQMPEIQNEIGQMPMQNEGRVRGRDDSDNTDRRLTGRMLPGQETAENGSWQMNRNAVTGEKPKENNGMEINYGRMPEQETMDNNAAGMRKKAMPAQEYTENPHQGGSREFMPEQGVSENCNAAPNYNVPQNHNTSQNPNVSKNFGENETRREMLQEPAFQTSPEVAPVEKEEENRTNQITGQSAALQQDEFMPFRDNGITECRKISPADFRILSRRDRGLLNNNFLRHGFSQYGHLIIGKREDDGRYILGVPGVYERQEALMAGMYGFPYFKETGGRPAGTRRFGYWYRLIDTPNPGRGNRC